MPSKSSTFRHLKPLSAYGRAAFAERDRNKFPEPITNFKSDLFNNRATKRKLDDSIQDSYFETPAKKPEISCNVSRPDEDRFISHDSPLMGQTPHLGQSQASPFAKTRPIKLTTSESVSLEHVACKSRWEPCSLAGTDPCLSKYEVVPHHPVFESEVNKLLCLNLPEPFPILFLALFSRRVALNTEADWEREKQMYVQLVHKHLTVREMEGLLTQVVYDSSGRQWQHLSDLTRRNYRAHYVPKISLVEWQAKSLGTHKRFEKVQKIFERSSIS
uniref:S100P-binding protein n=1 Tax=Hippocampus comes TaxID=109280 RepID=A0A3Q2YVK0_HIPCM